MLYRLLLVLLTLRLLAPPGLCLCQFEPAALWLLTGQEHPPPPPEDPDDHEPGCPASPLAGGMAVKAPHVPPHLLLAADLVAVLPASTAAASVLLDSAPRTPPEGAWPPLIPSYVSHCALLI